MSQTQCYPPTCGGLADTAQADTDMTSTVTEDLPTETLTTVHYDSDRATSMHLSSWIDTPASPWHTQHYIKTQLLQRHPSCSLLRTMR
eukprot:3358016-Pyramimonas_sp.AAC.1